MKIGSFIRRYAICFKKLCIGQVYIRLFVQFDKFRETVNILCVLFYEFFPENAFVQIRTCTKS